MSETAVNKQLVCYHCGEQCPTAAIVAGDKHFCCEGCKMVYQLLNRTGLCDYYGLNTQPGISQRISVRKDKFAFLDQEEIQRKLISFSNDSQTHILFYLPQVHCSSCLYLLEHLYKLEPAVVSCRVNFVRKEATVVFDHHKTSLRKVAELLTAIGYEPYISLDNLVNKKPSIGRLAGAARAISQSCK